MACIGATRKSLVPRGDDLASIDCGKKLRLALLLFIK